MSNFIYENTWEENQEAMKTKKLAIIPVGSSEQHGPALPVGTDWIIADYLARRVGEKTDKGLVTPVPLGTPSTTRISPEPWPSPRPPLPSM